MNSVVGEGSFAVGHLHVAQCTLYCHMWFMCNNSEVMAICGRTWTRHCVGGGGAAHVWATLLWFALRIWRLLWPTFS